MGQCIPFEHTADLGLRIEAADLDDLLRTAAEGLFDAILANRHELENRIEEPIALEAETPIDLLVDWLNELIFRHETQHRLYGTFDIRVASNGCALDGIIRGDPIDRQSHLLDHEVKAVTRHGLRLARREDGTWVAELILDL